MSDKVVSPLLESAHEFLEESLRNITSGKLNFAIVHAVTATELVLKERLARVNPALVLKDIDSKTPQKEQTVSLGALPRRLANLGMPLNPPHAKLIRDIAMWRHGIVHHMPTFDRSTAEKQLPQLLDFLASFLGTEFDTPLETFLSPRLYKDANRLLTDWQKVVAAAQVNATTEGNVLPDGCPECGASGVVFLMANAAVYCHVCGAALYRYDKCYYCRQQTFISYDPDGGAYNVCDQCIDGIALDYLQTQNDIARGK